MLYASDRSLEQLTPVGWWSGEACILAGASKNKTVRLFLREDVQCREACALQGSFLLGEPR